MKTKKWLRFFCWTCPVLFLIFPHWGINLVQAFTLGKTYDSSNWQEMKDKAPPPLLNWVKKGEFILKTGKLDFEWKVVDPVFCKASKKNTGKFDIDEQGFIVDKRTGKRPDFIFGCPFPKIESKDPRAAEKIMQNFSYVRFRAGGYSATVTVCWVGKSGIVRTVITAGDYLYYQGRYGGPIPNPNNFLQQQRVFPVEPFDLKGMVQMVWEYNEEKSSAAFAYVPTLRRVKRVSVGTLSEPFLGSDVCAYDTFLWSGKNQDMRWKLVGETTILAPFTASGKIIVPENEDGSINRIFPKLKIGYQVPGWNGAAWAPVNVVWHPRDVWIVEATPEDLHYNFGKMIFYIDKVAFNGWFREVYKKDGGYLKTIFGAYSYQITQKGRDTTGCAPDCYFSIDDKAHHATYVQNVKYPGRDSRLYLPLDKVGPNLFTVNAAQLLTK
jgi:hypothetical protein